MSAEPNVTRPPTPPAALDLAALLPLIERGERVVVVGPDGRPLAALVNVALIEELDRLREEVEDAAAIDASEAEEGENTPLADLLAEAGV